MGAVGLLIGFAWRIWRQKPAPVAGLASAIAAAVAMSIVRPLPARVWTGLGLLALAGVLSPKARAFPALPILSALPGAWLIGTSGLPGPAWVVPLVVGAVAAVGPVAAWFDEGSGGSAVPAVLLAISAGGVWLTVPDTEEALVLLGAMVIPTFLAWPLRVARLGAIGAYALVGLLLWVIAWGGRGREGSIVGAVACLGLFLVQPLIRRIGREHRRLTDRSAVLLQSALVFMGARVAGMREDPAIAAWIASSTLAFATIASLILDKQTQRNEEDSTTNHTV